MAMKMWDRRRAGWIPDQDTVGKWTGSTQEALVAAVATAGPSGTPHRDEWMGYRAGAVDGEPLQNTVM